MTGAAKRGTGLIRQPGGSWRPMVGARRTLFRKVTAFVGLTVVAASAGGRA